MVVSVSSGNDISCGPEFKLSHKALAYGFLDFDAIDVAVRRALRSRFFSGNFDPVGTDPYSSIPYSVVDSDEHELLTRQLVRESMVSLQNPQQILLFDLTKIKQMASDWSVSG